MAMEDKPQDILGLEIKPPAAGRPSGAAELSPGVPDFAPPTPTEQREAAEARQKEEGVKQRPVETREEREVDPPPPNAAAIVSKIVGQLEDNLQAAADKIKRLEQELSDERDDNRKMAEELSALSK